MEQVGYKNRESRDEKWRQLKADGERGLGRHTIHITQENINPKTGEITISYPIIYVVTWSTPKSETVAK
jgi:hypothetical protein